MWVDWYSQLFLFILCECLRLVIGVIMLSWEPAGLETYLMPDCVSLTLTFSLAFMLCIHICILQLLQGRLYMLPSMPKEVLNQGWRNFRSFSNCWLQQSSCWGSVLPTVVSGSTLSQLNPIEWSQLWEGHFWHSAPQ